MVLFTMLQEQHNKQIVAMAAANKKANIDAMMERINALVAGGWERQMGDPTGQECSLWGLQAPTSRDRPNQETQDTKVPLSLLQKCLSSLN